MASKAAKLRLKRSKGGRPRKEGLERYPSGDIKRTETQKETMSVAIEARGRIHGLETKDPRAGYLLGRMELDGNITEAQRQAGDEYAQIMSSYYALTGYAAPSARAQSLFSVKGHDGEVTETLTNRARAASNRMMEVEGILLQCVDGPQVKRTVYNVSVMDLDHLRGMAPQQLLWLRRGLTALADRKQLRVGAKSVIGWDIQSSEMRASSG
ncbi:hypothetical protein [Rhizobium sp. NZLR11]|uniref:hypothetical protein n=1 Tax=Rhizobium sp. NZLR11 TaxID=2731098 RepID=UPI001C838E4B|nr:hypothetical protein [Rhizobium sp. NZLR11]MBX5206706.1 hypothetical protein [Rhizobium sp. NZLR11]